MTTVSILSVRIVAILACIVGALGAVIAYRNHEPYLGARLFALLGAAMPAAVFARRFAAVLNAQTKFAWIVAAVAAMLLSLGFIAAMFPRFFFQCLARAVGH